MIGGTLSIQNLEPIRDAMAKIKPIDRSAYFGQYFAEVCQRIAELKAAEQMAADQDNDLEEDDLEEDDLEDADLDNDLDNDELEDAELEEDDWCYISIG